jgi:hypothetical protein
MELTLLFFSLYCLLTLFIAKRHSLTLTKIMLNGQLVYCGSYGFLFYCRISRAKNANSYREAKMRRKLFPRC